MNLTLHIMQGFIFSCIQWHIITIFLNRNPTLR